jgi:FixJ family two-component response regulator
MTDCENLPPHRLLVAIVDDEETVRRALSCFFLAAGLDVETFATGSEFVESASSHRPDCAVVDLQLPGLNGLEALTRLRGKGIDIPTVIVTGHHEAGAASRILAAGAAAYLRKPLDAEALLTTLLSAVRQRRRPSAGG